jgi:hypothetical protein
VFDGREHLGRETLQHDHVLADLFARHSKAARYRPISRAGLGQRRLVDACLGDRIRIAAGESCLAPKSALVVATGRTP